MKKLVLLLLAVILGLFSLSCFYIQSVQDKCFVLEEQVKESKSGINLQEKRRVDLVYNLADCVKKYDQHESDIIKNIVENRNTSDIQNVNTLVSAISESYPELKSDKNYKQFMNELSITENLIVQYRENYNAQVKNYNRQIKTNFLNRACLKILGYKQKNYNYLEYETSENAPQNLFD